ncbi:MAG: 3-deoxy-manno-octulosonate cytidylyltransferase [Pirellulaceae bacterium]|nr:3-deoxy-manno-octulosonate cytidylyltransferase [Planctomycetales bacterium]
MQPSRDLHALRVDNSNCFDGANCFVVIPARLESTRLPRKLLLRETGKTVLQHTYEAVERATLPQGICVAVDHGELADEVARFGGRWMMTDPLAASGTDRVAEVARAMPQIEIFVNVQGDEPEISGEAIDSLVTLLREDPEAPMATLATPIRTAERLQDPACVKVVMDDRGRALYFSRSAIPHDRDGLYQDWQSEPATYFQHLGMYAYRRDFLLELGNLPPAPLERMEKLEQLRVLSAGFAIQVGVVQQATRGIDTAEDYRAFVQRIRTRQAA